MRLNELHKSSETSFLVYAEVKKKIYPSLLKSSDLSSYKGHFFINLSYAMEVNLFCHIRLLETDHLPSYLRYMQD